MYTVQSRVTVDNKCEFQKYTSIAIVATVYFTLVTFVDKNPDPKAYQHLKSHHDPMLNLEAHFKSPHQESSVCQIYTRTFGR